MQDALIQFSFAGLSANYCFTTPERFALDIAAGLQGYLPGSYSTIIRSATEPVATDRHLVWYQVNADGAHTGRVFTYAYGRWVMQNPRRNPSERVWFEGSEAAAWSYDGGDGTDPATNPPTATTGAMWMVDHNYDFRFPLAAGTSAKPTTVSVGDTGGQEEVTLTPENMPSHIHSLNNDGASKFGRYDENDGSQNPWGSGNAGAFEGEFPFSTQPTGGDTDGETVAMGNLPPYRVGFWLKPSDRQFYTA